MSVGERRNAVVVAGHVGDATTAEQHLDDPHGAVRTAALGALQRIGSLTDEQVARALTDGEAGVRRRAAELAATRPDVDLRPALVAGNDGPVVAASAAGHADHVLPGNAGLPFQPHTANCRRTVFPARNLLRAGFDTGPAEGTA